MKNFFALLALVALLGLPARADEGSDIAKLVADLNKQAQAEGGEMRVIQTIAKSTGVSVSILQSERNRSGLSWGDLYIAHAIASASGKTFDQVAALKKKGQSWPKIAQDNNVSLGGKKVAGAKGPTVGQKMAEQNARDQRQADPYTSRIERGSNRGRLADPVKRWP